MIKNCTENRLDYKGWLKFLAIILLVLGIFFRFVNLDKKPYWPDETLTSAIISGYSQTELIQKFSVNHSVSIKDFVRLQYPNPDKDLSDSLKLIISESQDGHPPLYHILVIFWVKFFGHSVAAIRSVSAILSVLTLPCIYWLCLELFSSPLTGWIAIILMTVSPFQVLYAQEARPYSLLTLAVLLSSAALLRAARLNKKLAWVIYAASLALGFYSHLFFIFVAIGHVFYMIVMSGFRLSKTFISFLVAFFLGCLAFMPWIIALALNWSSFSTMSSWISTQNLSFLGAIRLWSENISLAFCDLWIGRYFNFGKYSLYFLIPPILTLVGYSFYFLYTKTDKKTYLFVFTLIGTTALALILADAVMGGNRQIWPRYIIPCYLGIQVSVAYLFANQINSIYASDRQRKLWQIITVIVVGLGIISCTISSQAELWWNKYGSARITQVSNLINQQNDRTLLIVDQRPLDIIAISHSLNPNVQLQFVTDAKNMRIERDVNNIFLMNPTAQVISELRKQNYQSRVVDTFEPSGMFQGMEIWQVEKQK